MARPAWVVHLPTSVVDETGCHGVPLERRILDYAYSFCDLGVPGLSFYWKDRRGVLGQISLERSADGSCVTMVWNPAPPPAGLTVRELDVLTLLSAGLSNKKIADRLGSSHRTVTTHIERILFKWHLRSRTAAAVIAVQRGWLVLPIPGGEEDCDALYVSRLRASPGSVRQDLGELRTG